MKRDLDVIRDILLHVEETGWGVIEPDELAKALKLDKETINYQLKLLYQAGYIEAAIIRGKEGIAHSKKIQRDEDYILFVKPWELTWEGHEYLDAVRDPEIWNKTKESAKEIGNFGIDTLKSIAKGFIKTKIKQHTGIDMEE